MTSGSFHIVPLGDIQVNRENRQRRDLTNIPELADSIRRLGLIHPLVITREFVLVTGERRYAACMSLGWPTVPIQYVDELDPGHLRAIELEENIKRVDITWQDKVLAVKAYHTLRASEESDWSQTSTATAIGLSQAHVNALLMAAEELLAGNPLVVAAPKLSVAVGIAVRARERRDAQVLDSLKETIIRTGTGIVDPDSAPPESILTADFREWILGVHVPRYNFLHIDFPYGIGADSFNQGAASAHGGYIDTIENWEGLMAALAQCTKVACTPSAHLMFWFSMRKGEKRLYEPTAYALERMGWSINPLPLVWVKSDGVGILPDPERGPRQIYETCFFGARGDRKIVGAVANAYSAPTVRDKHMSEKPEPMLRHFFRMFVDQNTVMLDPTCGSGSALRAAESLGASFVLGLEINEEFAGRAREALVRSRSLKRAGEVMEMADA